FSFLYFFFVCSFFFFFQAEDGIRDFHVTGVQTCALPIFTLGKYINGYFLSKFELIYKSSVKFHQFSFWRSSRFFEMTFQSSRSRSEERRVGKECSFRWW